MTAGTTVVQRQLKRVDYRQGRNEKVSMQTRMVWNGNVARQLRGSELRNDSVRVLLINSPPAYLSFFCSRHTIAPVSTSAGESSKAA